MQRKCRIVNAEKIIRENVSALPHIKAIAGKVNMSVSTLMRQFKLMYGKSIHEYYIVQRMEAARKLILEGGMSVKEMAAMLGYKQASPFIEDFKKLHGVSPGTLKRVR